MSTNNERTNQFIMFGCWNSLNKENGLESTMTKMKEHISENPVDFIAVAGDNYYPTKPDKKEKDKKDKDKKKEKKEEMGKEPKKKEKSKTDMKEIIPDNLLKGFDLLPKNVPIKMILGNHDLETNTLGKMELRIGDEVEDAGTCTILTLEQRFVSNNPNIQLSLMHYVLMNNTLVLMIDTSIYDPDDAESFLPCYNKEIKSDVNVESIILNQHAFIHEQIRNHQTPNLIIIGHHPITAIKNKKGAQILINPFPLFIEELRTLGQYSHLTNITYLCADLHLYQSGTVTIFGPEPVTISQYVVGSGGTALDPMINRDAVENEYAGILNYVLLENEPYSHGFLRCDCRFDTPMFVFIRSYAAAAEMGLGTRKRKRRFQRKGSKRKGRRQSKKPNRR